MKFSILIPCEIHMIICTILLLFTKFSTCEPKTKENPIAEDSKSDAGMFNFQFF